MKYSGDFYHDLSYGETAEDWVKQLLSSGNKIEVKLDSIASTTGNIFIEYESRGKPSGISTTNADYWIYKIDGTPVSIILDVIALKEQLRTYYKLGLYIKDGGDNNTSKGFLIPIIKLIKHDNTRMA